MNDTKSYTSTHAGTEIVVDDDETKEDPPLTKTEPSTEAPSTKQRSTDETISTANNANNIDDDVNMFNDEI